MKQFHLCMIFYSIGIAIYLREHNLSFWAWLIWTSIMVSIDIHFVAKTGFFHGGVVFHHVYRPHFLYSGIGFWTSRLTPYVICCEMNCWYMGYKKLFHLLISLNLDEFSGVGCLDHMKDVLLDFRNAP